MTTTTEIETLDTLDTEGNDVKLATLERSGRILLSVAGYYEYRAQDIVAHHMNSPHTFVYHSDLPGLTSMGAWDAYRMCARALAIDDRKLHSIQSIAEAAYRIKHLIYCNARQHKFKAEEDERWPIFRALLDWVEAEVLQFGMRMNDKLLSLALAQEAHILMNDMSERRQMTEAREQGDLKFLLLHDAQFREGYEAALTLLKSVSKGPIVPKHFEAAIAILEAADDKVKQ